MYCPVRKEARQGDHSGVVEYDRANRTPSLASRFRLGVSLKGCPYAPMASKRRSSATMTTILGRLSCATALGAGNAPAMQSAMRVAKNKRDIFSLQIRRE